jgi:KIF-binding protein
MIISKEQLTDIKEKFEKAQTLIDEDSKQDPPTEPFRSHYK